jgi:hypothetical protein
VANIGFRTFNGGSDLLDVVLGNLASATSVPETWMFAGRVLSTASDGEIVHAPGYDPVDLYMATAGSAKFQFYDGLNDSGGTGSPSTPGTTTDLVLVLRTPSGSALKWSIATNTTGLTSGWSTFTHTTGSVTRTSRTYPASGVIEFFNTAAMNARCALIARCNSSLSDAEVGTLTTDMAAWQALTSITNLWQFDQTPVADIKGTASQNTLTGTSVTANGFPLDTGAVGAGPPVGVKRLYSGARFRAATR